DSDGDRSAEEHRPHADERNLPEDHPGAIPGADRREGGAHVVGLAAQASHCRSDPGRAVHAVALFGPELRAGVERPIVLGPSGPQQLCQPSSSSYRTGRTSVPPLTRLLTRTFARAFTWRQGRACVPSIAPPPEEA